MAEPFTEEEAAIAKKLGLDKLDEAADFLEHLDGPTPASKAIEVLYHALARTLSCISVQVKRIGKLEEGVAGLHARVRAIEDDLAQQRQYEEEQSELKELEEP